MNKFRPGDWIEKLDLKEVWDPETGRTSFRRASTASETVWNELEISLGESVRLVREERGLSQDQVAYLLGLDIAEYSARESSAFSVPVGDLLHLYEVLGVSIDELCMRLFNCVEKTDQDSERYRIEIAKKLLCFDTETLADIYALLRHLV